jgi:hypothetical protein
MVYHSRIPKPPLSLAVESMWLYCGYQPPHRFERVLPSGTTEVIFNLREDVFRCYTPETLKLPIIKIEEAALALAALSGSTEITVTAKREVGQLHDKDGRIYPLLFTDALSGVRLARFVRVFQYLDSIMAASEQAEEGRRRMFYRHGRFFTFHLFTRRNRTYLESTELS